MRATRYKDPLPANTLIWYDGPWDTWDIWLLPRRAVLAAQSACLLLKETP